MHNISIVCYKRETSKEDMGNCCGMSMSIKWKMEMSSYIMPGLAITKNRFPALLLFIVFLTLAANHIGSVTKNKYVIDAVHFGCSWILMMSTMTGNGFVLLTALVSTLASRIILQRQKKERTFSCC
ncbi:uncharacterized protein NEMAJ01_1303 [Nematocida major]|uniref:uncharacterized protein n=1 Tax=Nematocida major TaxID=1912982 RepID=UPI00200760D1|nr:uncharacterized protein NEMAJ01_1303 [Nematocida major]KAH9386407.1 hypothetical protein NEMAJ01_1303 [Nematocida major]